MDIPPEERLTAVEDCVVMTKQEIDDQITRRRALMRKMVGTFYPGVVAGEIAELQQLKEEDMWERLVRVASDRRIM